jgi:hypothetical protein
MEYTIRTVVPHPRAGVKENFLFHKQLEAPPHTNTCKGSVNVAEIFYAILLMSLQDYFTLFCREFYKIILRHVTRKFAKGIFNIL